MIEELSLRNNRGSLLFQKRQRRVQKFTFELSESLQGVSSHCVLLGKPSQEGTREDLCGWWVVGGGGEWGIPFVHPLDYALGC